MSSLQTLLPRVIHILPVVACYSCDRLPRPTWPFRPEVDTDASSAIAVIMGCIRTGISSAPAIAGALCDYLNVRSVISFVGDRPQNSCDFKHDMNRVEEYFLRPMRELCLLSGLRAIAEHLSLRAVVRSLFIHVTTLEVDVINSIVTFLPMN